MGEVYFKLFGGERVFTRCMVGETMCSCVVFVLFCFNLIINRRTGIMESCVAKT